MRPACVRRPGRRGRRRWSMKTGTAGHSTGRRTHLRKKEHPSPATGRQAASCGGSTRGWAGGLLEEGRGGFSSEEGEVTSEKSGGGVGWERRVCPTEGNQAGIRAGWGPRGDFPYFFLLSFFFPLLEKFSLEFHPRLTRELEHPFPPPPSLPP